ncbi:MAG: hypothetical protein QOH72_1022 [Solirubrobacteraceae bacterium]|jgi:hypothetical protein|nr:hypothetical protein [Solirubrobacteraceae bacterium]
MEAPGRDVTADPLGPDPETLPDDAPRREETRPDDTPPEGDGGDREAPEPAAS